MGITYEARDGVAWITLDRPEKRNAIDDGMRSALGESVGAAEADNDVRVIVLTGAGTAFCAGVDLGTTPSSLVPRDALTTPLDRAVKPLVAVVNGPAAGGGCELALSCDLRIASPTATFSLPEVTIGSLPGSGGTQRLLRAVGPAVAMKLLLTGMRLDAEGALRCGLVSDVVAADQLRALADDLASRIARNAPLAVRAAKHAAKFGSGETLATGLALERMLFMQLTSTDDRAEGRSAFREKRPPKFTGR